MALEFSGSQLGTPRATLERRMPQERSLNQSPHTAIIGSRGKLLTQPMPDECKLSQRIHEGITSFRDRKRPHSDKEKRGFLASGDRHMNDNTKPWTALPPRSAPPAGFRRARIVAAVGRGPVSGAVAVCPLIWCRPTNSVWCPHGTHL